MPPKNVQSRTCRRSQRLFGKMEVADEHQLQTKTRRAVAEKCVKPSPSPSPKPSPCPTTHSPTPPLASRLRRSTRAVATVLSPKSPPKKSTNHMEGIFDSKPVTTRARRKFAKITQPQVSLREQTPPTEKLLPPPAEKKPQSPSSLRESINDDKESTPDSLIIEAAENEPQSSTSFEPLLGRDHEMPECSIASLPLTPLLTPPDAEIDTITSIKQDPQKCKTICVKLPIIPVFAPIPFTISESEKAVIQQKRKRILKAYQEKQIEAFLKAGIALQPKHTSTTNKTSSKKPERTRFQHCQKHRIQVKLDLCDGLLTIRNGRVLKRSARGIMKTKLRSMKARVMNAQCDYEKAVLPNKKRVLYNSLSTNSAKKNTASVNVVPHKLKFGSVAKNAVSNNENFKRVSHSSFASAHRINLSKLKQPLTRVSSNLPKTTKKHIELPTMLEITTKKTVTEPTVLVSPVPIIYKQPIKSKTVSRLKKLKNALKLVVKPKAILKRITKRRSITKNAGILKSILKRSNKSKSIPSNTPSIINDCTLHPQRRRMLMLSPAPTVQSKLSTKQTAIPRAVKPANSHLFLQSSTVNDTYNITQNPKPSTPFTNVNNGNPCLSNISTLEEAPISFTIPMPKLNATKQKIRLLVKNKFGNVVDTVVNLPNNGKATDSMQISIDRALGAEHVKSVLVHQADAPVSGKILKRTVKLNDAKVPSSTFLKFAQATKTSAKSNKCNNVKKVSFLTPQLPKIASTTPVKQLSKTASTVTPRTAHSTYLTKQFQSPRHSVQKALLNSAHCCSNPFTKTLSTLNKSTDGSFKRWEPLLLNESSKLPKIVKLAAGTRFRAVTFAKEPSVNLFKVQSRGRSKSASSLPASLLPVSGVLKTVKSPCKATFLVKPPTFKSKNLVKHRGKFTDACSGKRTALVAKSTSITSKLAPRTSIANVMSAKRLESVSKLRSFSANEILTKPENLITPNSKMSNFVRVSLSEPPRLPALLSKSVVNDTKASLAPAEPSKSQTVSPIKTAKRRLVFTESTKLLAAKNAGFEKAPIRPQKTRLAFSKVCINTADASVTSSGIEKSLSSSFVKEVPSVSLAEKSNATHTVPLKLKKTSEVSTKPVSTNSKTLPTVVEAEKPLGSLELLRQKSSIKLPLTNSIHNVSLESSTNQQEDDKFEPPMKRVRATSPMSSPSAIDPLTKKSHTALRTSMRVAKFKALEELHSSSKRLKVPITSSLKSANDIVVVPTPALNVIQNEAQSTVNYPSSTNLLNYQVNDQIKIPIPVNSLSPKKFQSTVKHLLAFPQIKNSKRKAEPLSEELPFTPQTIYKPCSLKRRPMPNAILPTTAAIAKPPPKKRLKRETIVPVRIKNIKRRPVPVKRTKYRKRIVLFHNMRQNSLNVLRVPTNFNPRSFSCLEDFFTAGMVERLQKRPPIRASRILGLVDDEMMESTAEKAKEKDASSALNLKSQKNVSNLPAAVKIAEIASAEVEKESKSSTKEVEKTRRQHRNTACFNVRSGPKLTKTSTHEMKLECLKKMDELLRLEPPKFRQHGAQKLGRALPVTFRKLIAFAQEYSKWNPSQITLAVQNMKMAKFTSMTLLPKFRVRRVMQSVPKNRIRKLLPIPRSALTKVAEKMQKMKAKSKKMKTFPKKVKKTVDKLKARTTEKKKQEPTPEKRIMTRQRQVTEQLTGKETLVKTLDKKVVQKRSKITVSQKRQIMKKAQKPVQNPLKKKVIEMPLNIRLLSRRTTRSMEKLATIRKKQTFEKLKPLTKKFQNGKKRRNQRRNLQKSRRSSKNGTKTRLIR